MNRHAKPFTAGLALVVIPALAATARGSIRNVERVSVASPSGRQADFDCDEPVVSADGRYVAFSSRAGNLVQGDTNNVSDVFVRDRLTGRLERVSLSSTGAQGNNHSDTPAISADGRYVAFLSSAGNLVAGDTNGIADIFVRDRATDSTERISVSSTGEQANAPSYTGHLAVSGASISADGRSVAFASWASNLVPGDTNAAVNRAGFLVAGEDLFVRDRAAGTTERISISSSGTEGNDISYSPAISADGRYVAFVSAAYNLVAGDTNGVPDFGRRYGLIRGSDIFVRDRVTGTTERVSVASDGTQGNDSSASPSISADGRYVAFSSAADNLVPGDTNGKQDVFLSVRQARRVHRVNRSSDGSQGNGESFGPSLSVDGRFVAFSSAADNLVPGDTNGKEDIFVWDRLTGRPERVSLAIDGKEGNNSSSSPSLSADGRYLAFSSASDNLVPADTNGFWDVFLVERPRPAIPQQIAVFRPSTGQWFLREADGAATVVPFGRPGDVPMPADYLGIGGAQLAVFRPPSHEWLIRTDDGRAHTVQFGGLGDVPVPADYLGLDRVQIAVFRPGTGEWFLRSEAGSLLGRIPFGAPGDLPVPADYLGTGRAQIAVFRSNRRRLALQPAAAQWFIRGDTGATVGPIPFGVAGDVPVPGDYAGLGRAQIVVYRPATAEWFLRGDSGQTTRIQFGRAGDVPVPADYDGTGHLQIAVFRPSTSEWLLRAGDGPAIRVQWGAPGDRPAPAAFPTRLGVP